MIKTAGLQQFTENAAPDGARDAGAVPALSDSEQAGDEHPGPDQPFVHRYQFPPSDDDHEQFTGRGTSAQINFQVLREVVRRVRKHHLVHRRRAEDAGYAEGQHLGYQNGYQDGYRDGLQAGHLAGFNESQQQQKESAEQWMALMNSLWNELSNLHQSTLLHLGQPLIELISTVVKQVVNHELAISRESLQQLVIDSLSMLTDARSGHLLINPLDRPLIDSIAKQLPEGWSIREDDRLTAGGCRLITDHGDVDATVESRVMTCIDTVHEQLINEPLTTA